MYGLSEIVVPAASSAFSALGCLTADFSFLQQRTVRMPLDGLSADAFTARVEELMREATEPLLANGVPMREIQVQTVALMRYAAQNDSMPVPFAMPLDTNVLRTEFNRKHRELYGYATLEPCVIESVRVQASKPSSTALFRPHTGRPSRGARSRSCIFDSGEAVRTAILPRETLNGVVAGPAIIEDAWSTVVVPPGWQARPDDLGNLFLDRSAA
jgi:N-methylhydantoinase A